MAVNNLDGRKVFGWCVAGDDNKPDPQGSGRIKVRTVNDHPDTPIDDLPWVQIGSQPGNIGGLSFNRPPQLGSLLEVYFPQGTKGSGHCTVTSILHNIPNPEGIDGQKAGDVNLATREGWSKTSRETPPSKADGPARSEQKPDTNTSGAEKLGSKVSYGEAPSMKDRIGTNSHGMNKGMLSTLKGTRSIFTAAQWGYYKNEPGTGKSDMPETKLPGEDGNIPDNADNLKSSIPKELFKIGYGNVGNMLSVGQKTDNKVSNMANQGNKTQKSSWLSAAQGELSKATNHLALMDAAFKIQTQAFLEEHLKKEKEIKQEFPSPYKKQELKVKKKIEATGKITIENFDELDQERKKTVEQRVGMIPTAATRGGVQLGGDELGPKFDSDQKKGLHAGLKLCGDLLLMMSNIGKKNGIQKSCEEKFVYESGFHEAGLQFAWFMSDKGKSGAGNTVPDDQRDPQYKQGSSMV